METEVAALFTPDVKEEAASLFESSAGDLDLLGDFENYVFAFDHRDGPAVLRVTHRSHRCLDEVTAELAWLRYMRQGGVRFCAPLASGNARFVESVGGGEFFVTAFALAPGRKIEPGELSEEFFHAWGAFIGRSHRLARSYRPGSDEPKRLAWSEVTHNVAVPDRLGPDDDAIRAVYEQTVAALRGLPTGDDAYGLIHTDLHHANFHWHDGIITAFDTDDCAWNWFIEDISTTFFYIGPNYGAGAPREELVRRYFPSYWRGYSEENELDPSWLDQLPLFMRFRTLVLYGLFQWKVEATERTEEQSARMQQLRESLLSDRPFVDVDFKSLI